MKTGIKMIVCTFMAAVALTFAVFTFLGFAKKPQSLPENSEGYILGEKDGNIAIFSSSEPSVPLSITNIELSQLRQADQSLVSIGITVANEEELMQLLEDLGS